MSNLAQRIVSSHKEAAKRAVAHMGRTRQLKLSSTEALELVASVLGVANWQTLLALAKEGRGPRIDEGKTTEVTAPVPTARLSVAQRLNEYFATEGGWGEHPDFPRKDWQYLVDNNDTRRGYWEHVQAEIELAGAMLPWDRDASESVHLCKAAGVGVEAALDDDGWVITDPYGYVFAPEVSTEAEAWNLAATEVKKHVGVVLKLPSNWMLEYTQAQMLEATRKAHAAYAK